MAVDPDPPVRVSKVWFTSTISWVTGAVLLSFTCRCTPSLSWNTESRLFREVWFLLPSLSSRSLRSSLSPSDLEKSTT
ncbi:hypothetical protein D3C76_835920 [compost metagenome]